MLCANHKDTNLKHIVTLGIHASITHKQFAQNSLYRPVGQSKDDDFNFGYVFKKKNMVEQLKMAERLETSTTDLSMSKVKR